MNKEIGLVSCVKTKQDEPAAPKELYTSDYFEKMRSYAEQHHDDWWILSVKHGLLDPDGDAIEPYEETLNGARKAEKRKWSEEVADNWKKKDYSPTMLRSFCTPGKITTRNSYQ